MPKLITAIYRRLCCLRFSVNSAGVLLGRPDPERDQAEKSTFTLSDMPPQETVIPALTLSCARGNDPEWIAAFCRVYNIRFAGAAEPQPLEPRKG